MPLSSLVPNEAARLGPGFPALMPKSPHIAGKSKFFVLSSAQDGPVSDTAALEQQRT
jgi:hypothetical protein